MNTQIHKHTKHKTYIPKHKITKYKTYSSNICNLSSNLISSLTKKTILTNYKKTISTNIHKFIQLQQPLLNELFILNGIFVRFNINLQTVEKSFNKYKCVFDIKSHNDIINKISTIENYFNNIC